jgi:teichoic acid transport system ATP-binding protein
MGAADLRTSGEEPEGAPTDLRTSGEEPEGAPTDLRTSGEEPEGAPTVVVEDLHVVYRVHGRGQKGNAVDALKRVVRGQRRPGMREIHAVRGVSLVARRGDAIGVIGRNGSGKSTLLRAIAGLLPPDRGQVFTDGQPSLLGVNAALVKDLTGARNIELGCLAMGMSPEEVRAKFDEIVEFSGIGDFVDLPMATYSSGMAARLRFAIAAAKSHEVLLIDEALATGDRQFRRRSRQRMNELREEAGTLFLVSHSLDVIAESCNRVIWVDRGVLRMEGDPASVIEAYSEEE